ncbi:L-ascorbate metabolism protein UlaG, beta-lactamase superfamily [Amycolatopsis xylanica]|uniref:L-ascorbate metabolism protein UlaG, beta-lactamase superfamily n=1 Tax=Amycolatopsis xylanica TaxID=589385 RepID=A0A1H3ADJ4_9PSEU|nr:MBL fold metallo-hydrolase [Amycolatopsis xylanica]SDX27770.1 L-ascorbate metabolism protein UlaG, beta-lactamase superfamily [Amycolatopsis xylanica]
MKTPFSRPDLSPYPREKPSDGSLRVTFLGVSTLLFDDGETAIMTDGFFSRPGKLKALTSKIGPNRAVVTRSLERAGVSELAAVIAVHSHYDHAMDTPLVASLTGAQVIGSTSTANIALGQGLPADRIQTPAHGEPLKFGRFTVTLLPSEHSPKPVAPGVISEPLTPPARLGAYEMGECYTVHIGYDDRGIVVNGSAGWVPGALDGYEAEVVYLGIGGMGKQSDEFRSTLWREIVATVGARKVVPIHWDDFFRPLDRPLVPLPYFADDLTKSMDFLLSQEADVELPVAWQITSPFGR